MLQAQQLVKRFGDLAAIDDVSLEFGKHEGEMVFIVGPNGAGKTTLINLLTGLVSPNNGRVVMDDKEITEMDPYKRVRAGLVRSFQVVRIFDEMTVRENLRTAVLSEHGFLNSVFSLDDEHESVESRVDELLTDFHLEEEEHTLAEELPHGNRKLVDVAMAFGLNPRYLLLDEPTSGVSTREKDYVIDTILSVSKDEGITTVTIEHDMDIVSEYADRLIALQEGRVIAEGEPEVLETDQKLRRVLLGVRDE